VSQAPLGRRALEVGSREALGPYTLLTLADPDGPPPEPGQFHMLAAVEHWGAGEDERPFLPRALAVLAAQNAALTFMLEDVGPGTARLCALDPGDLVWVTGPLGTVFKPPAAGQRAVVVAGGIGVPPMAYLAQTLDTPAVLAGFRDAEYAIAAELLPEPSVATDDGSAGHTGFVTELLREELDDDSAAMVYACGPPAMLEAVRALCAERDAACQLALESPMACGFGACFGCVVPLADGGYARTCVDGPVIDGALLSEVPVH
jgi:dihydroorotate dehydrogenase electron transfer subunit